MTSFVCDTNKTMEDVCTSLVDHGVGLCVTISLVAVFKKWRVCFKGRHCARDYSSDITPWPIRGMQCVEVTFLGSS